jgi:hypothetical protein
VPANSVVPDAHSVHLPLNTPFTLSEQERQDVVASGAQQKPRRHWPLEQSESPAQAWPGAYPGVSWQKPEVVRVPAAHSVHRPLNTPLALAEHEAQLVTPDAQQ